MNTLSIALIGCGRIAERHAKHISEKGRLVAVCDIIPEKADKLAAQYDVKAYYNIDDMLAANNGATIVSICTPNGLHAQHAIQALKAGYHVLVEKPMAILVHDCGEMIKVAEQTNRRLFVIKQNRFNPPVVAVKKALDDGKFGKIYSVQLSCFWNRNDAYYQNSWKGTMELDGGTLFTQFSHFIDLLYWFFGDVLKVQAYAANFAHQSTIEFEDTGVVILEFHSGTVGTINFSVNATNKNMEGSVTIIGEKGTVKIGGQYLNTLEYQEFTDNSKLTITGKGAAPNNYGDYVGSMSNHDKIYENLVAVFKNNEPISANFYEGLKTVEIIDRIYAAARHKR